MWEILGDHFTLFCPMKKYTTATAIKPNMMTIPVPQPEEGLSEWERQEYYMWQSWIEIEYYSVVYFERITKFDAL